MTDWSPSHPPIYVEFNACTVYLRNGQITWKPERARERSALQPQSQALLERMIEYGQSIIPSSIVLQWDTNGAVGARDRMDKAIYRLRQDVGDTKNALQENEKACINKLRHGDYRFSPRAYWTSTEEETRLPGWSVPHGEHVFVSSDLLALTGAFRIGLNQPVGWLLKLVLHELDAPSRWSMRDRLSVRFDYHLARETKRLQRSLSLADQGVSVGDCLVLVVDFVPEAVQGPARGMLSSASFRIDFNRHPIAQAQDYLKQVIFEHLGVA